MVKRQLEAEQKAAREADAGMKTIAASQAALAVASCGFYGGIFTGGGESSLAEDIRENNSESDWTHIISTDDQVLLRKARMAQDTKMSVICEAEERKNGKITEYNSLDISAFDLQKEDKEAINQKRDFGCIK